MTGMPEAQMLWVDREPGLTRYDVFCPYCNRVHHHSWLGTETRFSVAAPCGTGQRYRVRLSSLQTIRPDGRDDNAMDVPVPNWTE